ncbi:hypothetical protein IFO69_01700 [Echinicola sp. CAU 1574]|uniref:Outer membrane protein beta-barrel domain-containing protein n=1 Tax=Echinicola arenosa TaxID=2774144 RepID=A0ABR9AFN9_9BACT|nr:hypothetical protein [Echinicola arenosa]MBD8487450.1 hypothetical protein [Echinicola arenosa]
MITPAFSGEPTEPYYKEMSVVSVAFNAHYVFWKYLFVNGGPILDFETSDNDNWIDSQSGVGYSLGLGGKYDFDKFLIFINPNFKRHAVIPFKKDTNHQKLTEFGVQFGLGYRF